MSLLKNMITERKNGYTEIIGAESCQTLFFDKDEIHITGYRRSFLKKWIFYAVSIPLCGLPVLLLHWYPQFIHFKCIKTCLKSANSVLVRDSNDAHSVHSILTHKVPLNKTSLAFQKRLFSVLKIRNEFRYFIHKDIKYVWLEERMEFCQLRGWDNGIKSVRELLEDSFNYSPKEQEILLKIYGRNEIKILIPNPLEILVKEFFQPFYLFQMFSIILWLVNDYLSYAICVIFLSGGSIFITLYTTKKQRMSLQNLASKSAVRKVSVVRKGGVVEEIDPKLLVPGNIIQIPESGCLMPCDALLLHGNCIVNENTLTGESCPVTKTPPVSTNDLFNSVIWKRHVLFCGTEVMQTRYYGKGTVTAITVNTGFSTIKGELIRCLLHPKPLGFKFHEDSVKLVFCLFFVAACGIIYFCYISFRIKTPVKTLILDSLDLITIVVPPALPAALAAGIAYSKNRLLSKGIFCISPPKINIFGKLKLMCFDKTGTLTEEGLDLWGVLPCTGQQFGGLIQQPSVLNPGHPLTVALATCHTLTIIEGKLSGDPLDLSVFNSLNWELNEPGNETSRYDLLSPTIVKPKRMQGSLAVSEVPYEIGIVREFPFTSASQCMSVITRQLGANHMNLYCKGAPEKIGDLCETSSLPENFTRQLQIYTSMGFRVLGVAYKQFDKKFNWKKSQRVKRQDVEHQLTFLGLIIMQNKLKQVSTAVMNDLRSANIRCVMITGAGALGEASCPGDNLLTALSVSRECMMVLPGDVITEVKVTPPGSDAPTVSFTSVSTVNSSEIQSQIEFSKDSGNEFMLTDPRYHYAMDGKTWELLRIHFRDLIPKIIVKGTVFARMMPEQKTQLIEAFQDLDYIVGMCGDGTNDYGAMKAAHVGVSLSEAENSVAAPFTSKIQNVSCIVSLVQEGRCALISTFVIFKYMTVYSLIQFISVLIVYERGIYFGNMEFLYVDLIVTSLLALVIGRTGPSNAVVRTRPIARLMSFGNLFPLFLQVAVLLSTQVSVLQFLYRQNWFVPVTPTPEGVSLCWENSVVYSTSLFQYLILALVYSKGKPYRQPFYKDLFFMIVFVAMMIFAIFFCVWPFRQLADAFEVVPVEDDSPAQSLFRVEILTFPVVNLLLSFLIEVSVSDRKCLKKLTHFVTRKKKSKNRYKRVLHNPHCPC